MTNDKTTKIVNGIEYIMLHYTNIMYVNNVKTRKITKHKYKKNKELHHIEANFPKPHWWTGVMKDYKGKTISNWVHVQE